MKKRGAGETLVMRFFGPAPLIWLCLILCYGCGTLGLTGGAGGVLHPAV